MHFEPRRTRRMNESDALCEAMRMRARNSRKIARRGMLRAFQSSRPSRFHSNRIRPTHRLEFTPTGDVNCPAILLLAARRQGSAPHPLRLHLDCARSRSAGLYQFTSGIFVLPNQETAIACDDTNVVNLPLFITAQARCGACARAALSLFPVRPRIPAGPLRAR